MTTTITVSVCPRCGTIGKSGKPSCCGRGGSWFRNCGGAGKTKLQQHTWHEGIQACKSRSQFKTVVGQQLNGAQQKGMGSSQGAGMANYKAVIAATNTPAVASVNTSTPMSDTTLIITSTYTPDDVKITTSARTLMTNNNILMIPPSHTPVSTSISVQGGVNLLKIIVYIILVVSLLI